MTIRLWIRGLLDQWIVGVRNSVDPFRPPAPAFASFRLCCSNSATCRAIFYLPSSIFAPKELSPHSALMGGQFPATKSRAAFKNPIFYAGKFFGILPKNELSVFDGPKNAFLRSFSSNKLKFFCKMRGASSYEVGEGHGHGCSARKNKQKRRWIFGTPHLAKTPLIASGVATGVSAAGFYVIGPSTAHVPPAIRAGTAQRAVTTRTTPRLNHCPLWR